MNPLRRVLHKAYQRIDWDRETAQGLAEADDWMALADAEQDQPELDLASADWRAWQAQMGGV